MKKGQQAQMTERRQRSAAKRHRERKRRIRRMELLTVCYGIAVLHPLSIGGEGEWKRRGEEEER